MNSKNRTRRDDFEDDDTTVVPDGSRVTVPMMIMDAADNRRQLTDEAAREIKKRARDEYCRKLVDAWKTPGRDAAEPDSGSSPELLRRHLRGNEPDNAAALREKSYAAYKDRISRAWMMGRADPNAATEIEQQRRGWTRER